MRTHSIFRYTAVSVSFLLMTSNPAFAEVEKEPLLVEQKNKVLKLSEGEIFVIGEKETIPDAPTVQTEKLLKAAGTLGDPILATFSLPGVVQVDENNPAPAVRGSSPSANQFLVDGLPIGYLFHEFGNSIFNENLIRDFGLKTAGFGAAYGQATGAVFDVSLREPKNQPLEMTVDLSFLRAGIMAEGAISENQSFYLSSRYGLIQYLLDDADSLKEEEDIVIKTQPTAKDYQAKYLWNIADDIQFTLDATGAEEDASANFGPNSEAVRFDPGFAGEASLSQSYDSQSGTLQYKNSLFTVGHILQESEEKIGNGEFFTLEENVSLIKGVHEMEFGNHNVMVGAGIENHEYDYSFKSRLYDCSDFSTDCANNRRDVTSLADVVDLNIINAFAEDQWLVSDRLSVTSGLSFTKDNYLEESNVDPRFSAKWKAQSNTEINASIGKYNQLPDEEYIFPVIGNPNLENITAMHYVMGISHTLSSDENWSWNAEAYYKDIDNLVVNTGNDSEPYVNEGEGAAYGFEIMVNKELSDHWYGWATLALSKTERTNNLSGLTTPFSYDAPVVANMVFNYVNDNWTSGFRWTYHTGAPYTPIIGNKENPQFPGSYLPTYGDFNSERLDDYHRLDIRFEREFTKWNGSVYLDIMNLYGRQNLSGYQYENRGEGTSDYQVYRVESEGLLPLLGVKFKF